MKRILSFILTFVMILSLMGSVAMIDTEKAYARLGVDVNGISTKHREIYQPTDDPVYYYQPPVDENGNHDYFGYPIFGDPQDITDEEFFGKWNNVTNRWILEPYFRYSEFPDMAKVEEAAKNGDYTLAKKELREYYKDFTWKLTPVYSTPAKAQDYLDALSRNVFAYSYVSMTAIGSFNLPAEEWGKAELNVTNEFKTAVTGGYTDFNIMLASADKFWTTGQYYSKDALDPSVRPVLRMIVNGVTTERVAYKDAMVVAGAERDINYGYDEIIEVQEHGYYDDVGEPKGTCNADTKRSFVCFDISDLKKTDIVTDAKLVLTARTVITDETRERFKDENGNPYSGKANEKLLWATWYCSSAWEEDAITWGCNYFSDKFYFSCNDENAWDYITSSNTTAKGKVCDYHRFAQQGDLYKAYMTTGDERFAYTTIRQSMALINSIGVEGNVMNSLDMSVYLSSFCNSIYACINSEYMTDEIFTAFLKFAWGLCDWETEKWYGYYSNNWATYATSGNYKVCSYFPEFAKHDYWFRRIIEEHDRVFAGFTFEDGHCIELSQGYINTILSTFSTPMSVYNETGHEGPYSEEIYEVIHDIVRNGIYSAIGAPDWHGFNIADSSDIGSNMVGNYKTWYQYLFGDDEEIEYVVSGGTSGKLPENPTTNYPVTLRTFMRSGWDARTSIAMSFVNTAHSGTSHYHYDALSITMWAYGQYLLTDQGYGSDQTGDGGRVWKYNKSPVQHNLVTVNDTYDYLNDGMVAYTKLEFDQSYEKDFESNKLYDFVEYVCDGYSTAQTMQRSVTFMKEQKFWIVSDYAVPTDPSVENLFAQHWHVYPGANPTHDENYTIRTNFDDVNAMIVPLEFNEIDDIQYVDRLYSERKGMKITDKKAVITKSKAGDAKFTTLIIPINIDEDFEVTSLVLENENEIDDDLLNMAYFKIVETNTGKTNYYYYYHINDASQKPTEGVKVSNFVTDATTMVIQLNDKQEVVSVLITDGSYVKKVSQTGEEQYFFKADEQTTVSYTRNGYFVNVVSSLYNVPEDLEGMQLYMENVKAARLDGEDVKVTVADNIVTFAGSYGNSNISSGSGGSGGGGSVASKPPVKEEDKTEEDVKLVEPSVEPVTPSYEDVKENDWYFEYVEELTKNGIVSGDGTGKFNPSDNVTREQFLKMLIEATGIETEECENTFEDVMLDAWYKPYVLKAKNFGIVNGISDTEFGVGTNITRQDMAVMITRVIKKTNINVNSKDVDAFDDLAMVSDYARDAVIYMKSIGLIEGYNNQYRPNDNLTRAEAAKVISELLKLI
ncbi:MAG: S-layer homology domain-containing protein [Clostridia bacterium]|nr:S-layer homology domain-containing protein [Clostridia bacterium]